MNNIRHLLLEEPQVLCSSLSVFAFQITNEDTFHCALLEELAGVVEGSERIQKKV
jgi:hypothetical protein